MICTKGENCTINTYIHDISNGTLTMNTQIDQRLIDWIEFFRRNCNISAI